ncbi:MAG: NTP transferase domain-containing protein [Spirochaetes bacterium]|nr:NTP transferase domain-containing protein [Spirochaetota bacterium]
MGHRGINTAVFVQVRLDSARLPCKALLPLKGGPVIQHVMRALKPVRADYHVLLTDKHSTEVLNYLAGDEGFDVFSGPADDVLERYYLASRFYGADTVIRATGDNPLVSAYYAERILTLHREERADLSHYIGIPLGTGVEVINSRALETARNKAKDPFEHEHITTYMYRHRDIFKVMEKEAPPEATFKKVSVSIDTGKDYILLRSIYNDLYNGSPVELNSLISWLKGRF